MTKKGLPFLPLLQTISERLPLVFPEGTPHRNYVTREMAAKTVFVMFYDRSLSSRRSLTAGQAPTANSPPSLPGDLLPGLFQSRTK